MISITPLPECGSRWRHKNGNLYTVLMIANQATTRPEEYPVTVVYQGENGLVWARTADRWFASMSPDTNPTKRLYADD